MQISFERSGGFAGMVTQATIDSDELPLDEATVLAGLIRDANFFALPATLTESGGADQFQYVVTVKTDEQEHTIRVGDQSAPDSLRPLLQTLTRLARSQPGT
jgi:hypothetical protein